VITEALFTAHTLLVIVVCVLEVDEALDNLCEFLWNGRDREVVISNRSILKFVVVRK